MKTKCYCIFCKKHPLHSKRKEFKDVLAGWDVEDFISSDYENQGTTVHCLSPSSDAFYELGREETDFTYPVTAYGDGIAITGVGGPGYLIRCVCGNEEDEE